MIKLKAEPSTEVVSASDVRTFLRMSSTDYDTTLTEFATAARQLAEHYTRRAFITQSWYRMLDGNELTDTIRLPRPPIQSITSVKYYDDAGTVTTLGAAYYTLDSYSEPGWLILNEGYSWPACRDYDGVLIEYVAGYGAAAANVPIAIKTAITEAAAYSYVNGKMGELPEDSKLKLKPYRIYL